MSIVRLTALITRVPSNLSHLILVPQHQEHQDDPPESAKCRWIHCSFRDQNYLKGFLWALSDELEILSDCFNRLDVAVQQHARFSKHGKYFTPCAQKLSPRADSDDSLYPMLMLSPFLDWSVLGSKPPLRFQVDRREGFRSTRSSVHQLRSILQHFYRLEDTGDREASQVFAKHKPWSTYSSICSQHQPMLPHMKCVKLADARNRHRSRARS